MNSTPIQLSFIDIPVSTFGDDFQVRLSVRHLNVGENILIHHHVQTLPRHNFFDYVQNFGFKQRQQPHHIPQIHKCLKQIYKYNVILGRDITSIQISYIGY